MANERELILDDRPVERELRTLADDIMQQTPCIAKLLEAGILEAARSGIGQMAPDVGDLAELFELPDVHGKLLKLADLLAREMVVLIWYQGGWSSCCNVGLQGMSSIEPQIRALGATLVVGSPELRYYVGSNARRTAKTLWTAHKQSKNVDKNVNKAPARPQVRNGVNACS